MKLHLQTLRPRFEALHIRYSIAAIFGINLFVPFQGLSQEMIYSTALSTGDPIQVPGVDEEWTVRGIGEIEWSGEFLGIFSSDESSRGFLSFWYPGADAAELGTGSGWPFPQFEADPGTKNREGNPPGSPIVTGISGPSAYDGNFILQTSVEDADTMLIESWPAVFSAGNLSGLQHWYHGYLTPTVAAPNGDAVYVVQIDLEEKQGWLHSDGTVEVLVDENTPIPSELVDASYVFWGGIVGVLPDRTTVHFTTYNTNGTPSSGKFIYSTSPGGAVTVLQDTNGTIPSHPDLTDGADTYDLLGVTTNQSGEILFRATVGKAGEILYSTLWSTTPSGEGPNLELSTLVEYTLEDQSKVTFDRAAAAFIADNGDILFEARVEGESRFSVWRKLNTGEFKRLSPVEGSPLPGHPDYLLRHARIKTMHSSGRCVLAFENDKFRTAYYLEREDGSFLLAATVGDTIADIEKPIGVGEIRIGDNGEVAMVITTQEGFVTSYAVVIGRDPADVQPTGTEYIWDGGAGTSKWHSVVNGRSNWVDAFGVPWDTPPDSFTADVRIDTDVVVELTEKFARARQINLLAGSLEVGIPLEVEGVLLVQENASLVLQGSSIDAQLLVSDGLILKEEDRVFTLIGDKVTIDDSELVVENGLLRLWSETTTLDGGTLRVSGGTVNVDRLNFEGSSPRIEVMETARLEIEAPQLTFMSDTTISTGAGATVVIGKKENQTPATLVFDTDTPEERRIVEFVLGVG